MPMWVQLTRRPEGAAGEESDYIGSKVIPLFTNEGEMPLNVKRQTIGLLVRPGKRALVVWYHPLTDLLSGPIDVPDSPGQVSEGEQVQ
jgi:hypothetical protein